ncbi:hypothetical protein E2562_002130 [Oryza meyeriana var. granulata]|uniref:Aminotransferase-like plant mobile domain-containing protein n=1 Tax=Oryza meyeriana var. granulata TaxID=110450 RepID=A0A6G1EDX9_9ORYZ|nr:hypothetical protein E2562_002130 [Oryza meyeriana var. granulata]
MDAYNGNAVDKYGQGDFDDLKCLKPLRARVHTPLPWDERYAYYIRRAGFLPLARIVNRGLPQMDHSVLTAMVDSWRPKTHAFHLVCGELTVMLQDTAMILSLPVEDEAVTGDIRTAGWLDML